MKKHLAASVTLLVVALMLGGVALAGRVGDSAQGLIREPDGRTILFTAHGSGTAANGHVMLSFLPDERVIQFFDVTCLNVVGNRAYITARLSNVVPPSFTTPVTGVVLWLIDGKALGAPDQYAYGFLTGPQPCLSSVPGTLSNEVFRGDIVIRDTTG
jgi:hypothetical protein